MDTDEHGLEPRGIGRIGFAVFALSFAIGHAFVDSSLRLLVGSIWLNHQWTRRNTNENRLSRRHGNQSGSIGHALFLMGSFLFLSTSGFPLLESGSLRRIAILNSFKPCLL